MYIVRNYSITMRYAFITIMLVCLISVSFYGQKANKIKRNRKADDLFQKAMVLSDSAKFDKAIALFKEASILYRKKRDIEMYIKCRYKTVWQSMKIKVDDELLNAARENVALANRELGTKHDLTGSCLSALASVFAYRNQIDSAIHYYTKEKELWEYEPQKNKIRIANVSTNLAWIYTKKGGYEKATSLLSSAVKIKIDSLGNEHPDIAKIYGVFGIIYSDKGIVDSSILYHGKALKIREKLYKDTHPIMAESYRNIGIEYKRKGDYKTAMVYYKKALHIWKKQYGEIHRLVALCYNSIGIIHANLGDFKQSNEYYKKSLEISLKLSSGNQYTIAACYANMGSNYHEYGELGNAMLYAQKAFNLIMDIYGPDNPNCAAFYNNLGAAYVDVFGDYSRALKYYKKSLELKLKVDSNNLELFSDYNNIGAVYRLKGDYELALSYHKTGLGIYLRQNIEKHENTASAYTNIGEIYRLYGDYGKALAHFEKAHKIRSELFGINYFGLAEIYLNIGEVHSELGKPEKEKEYYEKGLRICLENFGEENVHTVGFYQALAKNAIDRKDFTEAASLLKKTLNIQHKIYPKEHPDISKSFTMLGFVYAALNKYDVSSNYYIKALDANYIGGLSDSFDYNYILDEIQYLETILRIADMYFKKYKFENNIQSLTEAVSFYKKASNLVFYLSSGFYIETSKLSLLNKAATIFEKAVVSLEILYQATEDKNNMVMAFGFSEQNKSSILYEAIVKCNLNIENAVDSLWVKQKDLEGRIGFLKTKLLEREDSIENKEARKGIDSELIKAIVDYQQLTEKKRSKKSNNQLVLFHNQSILNEIQQKLKPNELMLEYFISDSALYCFVIGKHLLEFEKINIQSDFKERLSGYILGIKKHRFNEFQKESQNIYNELIYPVKKYFSQITKLIIIPDGQLLNLSFGSLISQKLEFKNEVDFSNLDYLIKEFEIVYQYSANLWLESVNSSKNRRMSDGFIGIAPFGKDDVIEKPDSCNFSFIDKDLPETILRNVTNENNEYLPLPFSGKEINEIADLFINNKIKAKKLLGSDASEEKLKNIAREFKYLHIATHGIINNIHPELSGLAFIRDKKQQNQQNLKDWKLEQNTDGILYANEIYDLDLNADLVVLSACETGIGKYAKGEGVLSLTRGFLYRKVPNVLFSLWKINDKSTCDLMTEFYKNVLQNKSYSNALRQAKLKIINDKNMAFPSNWAAFSLIGK